MSVGFRREPIGRAVGWAYGSPGARSGGVDLASVASVLAVLCGLAFIGTGFTHLPDDGAV
ncbi:hypothetical protein ACFWVP_21365 [Streptomyces sp. NPDC058637]|uniref:hypothetical protein n=1 Tax=Streptomyces sp. NPDC058637 TaxID=3346569 RepID=UPI003659B22C